ncbi:MAG: NAD-binding protein [Synechococcales bacterium]|nr:NAD-binding protein [Synechococcales bacterium]
MHESFQRFVTGGVFFTLTIVVAVIGYSLLGWDLLDAFYMVIITIFGVGYGEVRPLDTPGERIFTILVIFAGFISVAYIVGGVVQMMMEGEINRALDNHRKLQGIEKMQNHVVVCGFGRIGQILARELQTHSRPFVVIDHDPERIVKAEELGYSAYAGNAADEDVLQFVGIQRAKTLATVLPDDATNVFITLTARELNPDLVIVARGELPATEKKLRLAGANHVVLPASISAQRITNLITRPTAIDFLDESNERTHLDDLLAHIDLQIDELTIPSDSPLVGSTLGQLEIQGSRSLIIVAVRRADGTTQMSPNPACILNGEDTLILMGRRGEIPQLARYHHLKRNLRYRGART